MCGGPPRWAVYRKDKSRGWILYVVLLQGRMTAGWRGRWAAQLTIAGFAVIVFSLVGVNLLGLGLHGKAY